MTTTAILRLLFHGALQPYLCHQSDMMSLTAKLLLPALTCSGYRCLASAVVVAWVPPTKPAFKLFLRKINYKLADPQYVAVP